MSAIWVEQPPSASAAANSAATDRSLIVRSAGIRPVIPCYSCTLYTILDRVEALVQALQRKIVPLR
jgi:hypothetical protein